MIHHNNKCTLCRERTDNPRTHEKRKHNKPTKKFISHKKEGEIEKTNNNQAK
tara:strand:+ start:367 stop:522 length:156 start_codon:yes stop_codon:yes gene_type:complete